MLRRDSNPRQMSCTRLGPLKDALPTELHRHNAWLIIDDNTRKSDMAQTGARVAIA